MNTEETQAKISEIFLSYQGEGPFTGSRQLFVRFYGCNLACAYCDTTLESYKSFSREALLGKVLDFEDDYNEFAITGGEPLLYADFLAEFLPLFTKHRKHKVYLETNGVLPGGLRKIIDHIDIIAMDLKLPSSSKNEMEVWSAHKEFIRYASDKELITKAVITDSTTIDDIKEMATVVGCGKGEFAVILQPVSPINSEIMQPDEEMISFFKEYLKKETGREVMILGQAHKYLGIR